MAVDPLHQEGSLLHIPAASDRDRTSRVVDGQALVGELASSDEVLDIDNVIAKVAQQLAESVRVEAISQLESSDITKPTQLRSPHSKVVRSKARPAGDRLAAGLEFTRDCIFQHM